MDRPGVDPHQRLIPTRAPLVNCFCDELLAGTRLAEDQRVTSVAATERACSRSRISEALWPMIRTSPSRTTFGSSCDSSTPLAHRFPRPPRACSPPARPSVLGKPQPQAACLRCPPRRSWRSNEGATRFATRSLVANEICGARRADARPLARPMAAKRRTPRRLVRAPTSPALRRVPAGGSGTRFRRDERRRASCPLAPGRAGARRRLGPRRGGARVGGAAGRRARPHLAGSGAGSPLSHLRRRPQRTHGPRGRVGVPPGGERRPPARRPPELGPHRRQLSSPSAGTAYRQPARLERRRAGAAPEPPTPAVTPGRRCRSGCGRRRLSASRPIRSR